MGGSSRVNEVEDGRADATARDDIAWSGLACDEGSQWHSVAELSAVSSFHITHD